MSAEIPNKIKHRETLLEYMSNPDNPILNRSDLGVKVLGFSAPPVLYQHFTPAEITEMEYEALAMRRQRYASQLAKVDKGLLERAATGDPAAAKLVFQRYEGWTEKQRSEVTFDGPLLQQILAVFPPELADRVKTALITKYKELT